MEPICVAAAVALALAGCSGDDSSSHGAAAPFGACDTIQTNGSCTEYLQHDDYARSYCLGGMGGSWIPTCPTANRVASCHWPSSIQYWYTSYTGSLSDVQSQCSLYGTQWTTY
jgi:hypothetical protein